ncbi:MAG TPA: PilZ domain-containing protein [Terriglobales bacterium]|jgi:hypothetical protein|nr:PilZ domain-containing protein [Terriglobales bacterium]
MTAVLTEFTTRQTIEFRKPVLTRVDVSWQDASGTWQTVAARMEDRSAGGACLRVKMPIPVGSNVRIRSRQDDFDGETRHCRADGADFLIGIQREVAERANPDRSLATPQQNRAKGPPVLANSAAPTVAPSVVDTTIVHPTIVLNTVSNTVSNPVPNIVPNVAAAPPTISQAEMQAESRAELRTNLKTEVCEAVREAVRAELQTELQPKRPATQAGKENKSMPNKWLELPWRKNPANPSRSGSEDAEVSDGNSNSNREKENFMSDLNQPMPKAPVRSAREVPTFQVDLSPMEDIYRAIGIMNPPRGYSIIKVVEMLNSEHIRDLSKDMKRAAVLMALEAAGTSLDQLQRDAKARQDALDAHEAQQRKQVEAEWARKAEEIVQIQAEMDSIKAHYTGRISRNLDGVARQKATFAEWVNTKQQECQGMADAIELCSKAPASAASSAPASTSSNSLSSEVSLMKANSKTV